MNHRVQRFTRDGQHLQSISAGQGSGPGEMNMPWGVAADEQGDVYVADWRNDRVQKFTADGEFVMEFGSSGDEKGQFNRPASVAVDAHGDIYVSDWLNDRVQMFNAEGRFIEQFIGDANLSISGRQYILANPTTLRLREMTDLEPTRRLSAPGSVRVDSRVPPVHLRLRPASHPGVQEGSLRTGRGPDPAADAESHPVHDVGFQDKIRLTRRAGPVRSAFFVERSMYQDALVTSLDRVLLYPFV